METFKTLILAAVDRHREETGLSDGQISRAAGLHSDWLGSLRATGSASFGKAEILRRHLAGHGSPEVRRLVCFLPATPAQMRADLVPAVAP